MGLISLVLPSVGEKVTSSDPRIVTAFSTLQTVINGNLNSENIASSFKEALPIAGGQSYQSKVFTKVEFEAGLEFSATRATFIISPGATIVSIGGIATGSNVPIVPAGQKVKGTSGGGTAIYLLL